MRLVFALALTLPVAAFAAGGDDSSAPTPPSCAEGLVYDTQTGACVAPQDSRLDDGERMNAVRSYAYAAEYDAARRVLAALEAPEADLALTYQGFVARKTGDMDAAARYYDAALIQNPDNHLARSYRAQGWLTAGKADLARAELSEIRARGGRGTWAEASLRLALETGSTFSY